MNVHEMHRAFMTRVEIADEDSCWIYTGPRNEKGYGYFNFKGLQVRAHRFAAAGFRMPATSRFACHRCDNPPCVNPEHLFFATAKDNTLDMIQKGRMRLVHARGERTRHSKLTRAKVDAIRAAYMGGGESYRTLAEQYGVTPQAIYHIIKWKAWK